MDEDSEAGAPTSPPLRRTYSDRFIPSRTASRLGAFELDEEPGMGSRGEHEARGERRGAARSLPRTVSCPAAALLLLLQAVLLPRVAERPPVRRRTRARCMERCCGRRSWGTRRPRQPSRRRIPLTGSRRTGGTPRSGAGWTERLEKKLGWPA